MTKGDFLSINIFKGVFSFGIIIEFNEQIIFFVDLPHLAVSVKTGKCEFIALVLLLPCAFITNLILIQSRTACIVCEYGIIIICYRFSVLGKIILYVPIA